MFPRDVCLFQFSFFLAGFSGDRFVVFAVCWEKHAGLFVGGKVGASGVGGAFGHRHQQQRVYVYRDDWDDLRNGFVVFVDDVWLDYGGFDGVSFGSESDSEAGKRRAGGIFRSAFGVLAGEA